MGYNMSAKITQVLINQTVLRITYKVNGTHQTSSPASTAQFFINIPNKYRFSTLRLNFIIEHFDTIKQRLDELEIKDRDFIDHIAPYFDQNPEKIEELILKYL